MAQGWVLSWHPPLNITVAVAYYRVEYRRDDDSWMYTDPIPYDTAYLCKFQSPFTFSIFLFNFISFDMDFKSNRISFFIHPPIISIESKENFSFHHYHHHHHHKQVYVSFVRLVCFW